MRRTCLLVFGLLFAACDTTPASPAAADQQHSDEDLEFEKRMEERKQKRLAEQKAADEAAARKKTLMEAVAIVPETLPKQSIGKACQEVGASYDAFMNRMYADEPETVQKWNDAKGAQLPMITSGCTKSGSLEVAACQKYALDNAQEELKGEQTELLRTCIDTYGRPSEVGVVPPQ